MSTRCVLGIDIGGRTTKLALVAAEGRVLAMDTLSTKLGGGETDFVSQLMNRADALLQARLPKNTENVGIAVAIAGLIDSRRDRMVYGPNLEALTGVPLVKLLREHFGCPVILDTDCNAACLGELRVGAGKGSRRLLSLVVGTGLGVGVAVDGNILRVAHECVGDAGHVIVQPGGPCCGNGCHGCAEALVSASALESRYCKAAGSALQTKDVIDRARAGDEEARAALQETGYWLGIVMASLTPIFFPDRIVVSGGLAEAGLLLLDSAERSFRASAAPACSEAVEVRLAALGWRATVIGAATMLL